MRGSHNEKLRKVISESGLTQAECLKKFNKGQVKPMALRTLKSYLAKETSKTRRECPAAVAEHMERVLKCCRHEGT